MMKCLSVKQPWANRIASGEKRIETRTRRTHYRGVIAIASSKIPAIEPAGCVVAIATLWDCCPMVKDHEQAACCELYEGAWSWFLKDIRKLDRPLIVKGRLGIYEIDFWSLVASATGSFKEKPANAGEANDD